MITHFIYCYYTDCKFKFLTQAKKRAKCPRCKRTFSMDHIGLKIIKSFNNPIEASRYASAYKMGLYKVAKSERRI